MKVIPADKIPARRVEMEGAVGVFIRELVTERDGAPHFAMRRFDLEPGGHTPMHDHPWEHEVYILAGEGELRSPTGARPFRAGDAVYVPVGETHQFVNSGATALGFL
ncbi:MAG: cupin domain-containing protein [Armatimonadetes bacterium]|nr:cupin domain-containing protein [Armatimonadota bacterium]